MGTFLNQVTYNYCCLTSKPFHLTILIQFDSLEILNMNFFRVQPNRSNLSSDPAQGKWEITSVPQVYHLIIDQDERKINLI